MADETPKLEVELRQLENNSNSNNKSHKYTCKNTGVEVSSLSIHHQGYRSWWRQVHATCVAYIYENKRYLAFFGKDYSVRIDIDCITKEDLTALDKSAIIRLVNNPDNPVTLAYRLYKIFNLNKKESLWSFLSNRVCDFFPTLKEYKFQFGTACFDTLRKYPEIISLGREDFIKTKVKEKSLRRVLFSPAYVEVDINEIFRALNWFKDLIIEDKVAIMSHNKAVYGYMEYLTPIYKLNRKWFIRFLDHLPAYIEDYRKSSNYFRDFIDVLQNIVKINVQHSFKYFPKMYDTFNELEEHVNLTYVKVSTVPKSLVVNRYTEFLEGKEVAGFTVVIPRSSTDLLEWHFKMKHCIHTYTPSDIKTLIGLCNSEGKMVYNAEIDTYNMHEYTAGAKVNIRQIRGHSNLNNPYGELYDQMDKDFQKHYRKMLDKPKEVCYNLKAVGERRCCEV